MTYAAAQKDCGDPRGKPRVKPRGASLWECSMPGDELSRCGFGLTVCAAAEDHKREIARNLGSGVARAMIHGRAGKVEPTTHWWEGVK